MEKRKLVGEKKEKILRKRHSPISEAMNLGAGPDSLSNQKTIVLTYKRAAYPAPTARLSGARGRVYIECGGPVTASPRRRHGDKGVGWGVETTGRAGWLRGQVSRVMSLPLERHTAG